MIENNRSENVKSTAFDSKQKKSRPYILNRLGFFLSELWNIFYLESGAYITMA